MASNTFASRVSGSDFFAILTPGFYIFIAIYALTLSFGSFQSKDSSLWEVIFNLSLHIQESPSILIFIFFGAYLFGSIFRTLPVNYAEKIIPPFTTSFPYPEKLTKLINILKDHHDGAQIDPELLPKFGNELPLEIFNYWRYVICINSKEGFEFYRSFETRVRFFTGIIWASVTGVIFGGLIIIKTHYFFHPSGFPLLLLSLIIFFTFGLNFRRVRRHEARALLTIFCAFQKKNKKNEID